MRKPWGPCRMVNSPPPSLYSHIFPLPPLLPLSCQVSSSLTCRIRHILSTTHTPITKLWWLQIQTPIPMQIYWRTPPTTVTTPLPPPPVLQNIIPPGARFAGDSTHSGGGGYPRFDSGGRSTGFWWRGRLGASRWGPWRSNYVSWSRSSKLIVVIYRKTSSNQEVQ